MSKTNENNLSEIYAQAMQIAKTGDVSTPPGRLVLFSISFLPTKENKDKAFAFVHDNPGFMMIDHTPCGIALEAMELHKQGLSSDQIAEIWSVASARLISQASGNVTVFVKNADPKSVFRRIELPAILQNPKIQTINTLPKQTFVHTYF